MKINKLITYLPLLSIVFVGAFLRLDRLSDLMPFIGDQGWFYLSAIDATNGNIPLVGITSSHTWLHQGPFWTYLLALVLPIFKFNPVSGAYLTAFLDLIALYVVYRIGKDFFTERLGLISAALYSVSPLIIMHARLSYHTSPISFLVALLIFSLLKTIQGKAMYFPLSLLTISLLYNFELATIVFIPIVVLIVLIGIRNKEKWVKKLLNGKIITMSLVSLFVPMLPILIYDVTHGFPQTVKYGGWFFYKLAQFIGIYPKTGSSESISTVIFFFFKRYQLFAFSYSYYVSVFIFIASIVVVAKDGIRNLTKPIGVILLATAVPVLGLFLSQTSSEAYLPMLFPGLIISIGYLFSLLFETKIKAVVFLLLLGLLVSNAVFIYKADYMSGRAGGFGMPISERINASKEIITKVKSQPFRLKLVEEGSNFESSTMNYEYIIWWLSNKRPTKIEKLVVEIRDGRKSAQLKFVQNPVK